MSEEKSWLASAKKNININQFDAVTIWNAIVVLF